MKNQKLYTVLFGVVSLLAACSGDYLDLQDPNRESADTYWTKEQDYRLAINAAYSCFRLPGYFGRWYHADMILRGDEGWSKSPAPHWIAIATFNTTSYSSSEGVVQPWLMIYRQIYYCNQVFDYMNDRGYALFTDKEEADRILGQAYFMRGFAYWFLAGTYARGPLQLNSTDEGPVVEQEAIYRQALSDFQQAEGLLPEEWPAPEKGRVTIGGAKAMIAKVAMQLAGYFKRPGNDATQATAFWQMAKDKMDEIEALGIYELMPQYRDNFSEFNELNQESIFEIVFRDEIYNGKEVGTQRGKFIGFPVGGIGAWHDVYARPWLLDEFRKETDAEGKEDPRLRATLIFDVPGDTTSTGVEGPYADRSGGLLTESGTGDIVVSPGADFSTIGQIAGIQQDKQGDDWILFTAVDAEIPLLPTGESRYVLMLNRLPLGDDGWPTEVITAEPGYFSPRFKN